MMKVTMKRGKINFWSTTRAYNNMYTLRKMVSGDSPNALYTCEPNTIRWIYVRDMGSKYDGDVNGVNEI